MVKIEPRFSEAINGASVNNCYIESGYSGKVQTRLRGRKDLINANSAVWDNCLAAFESSKTHNIYMITNSDYRLDLRVLRNGNLSVIKTFDFNYTEGMNSNFAEMRFLNNSYTQDFAPGNYAILFTIGGHLFFIDDLNPVSDKIREFADLNGIQIGSVCVVANRIIAAELNSPTWYYSSVGAVENAEQGIAIFNPTLDSYDAEYSGDNIVHVSRVGGIRLAVFGTNTLEIWDITGNPEDPFTTSYQGQVYKLGCVENSITEISDVVYFCGIEDLSGRNAIYSISREGLKKLSENPLDTETTEAVKGTENTRSGKYSENAVNFYLLHLQNYSLAYNINENSFCKFYHTANGSKIPFNCLISSGENIIGLHTSIYRTAEMEAEYTGHFTEKMIVMPIFDNGGAGHFRIKEVIVDMQTISTPRTAPPDNNCIVIDYSPDGTQTFRCPRKMHIPNAGMRKQYPLKLWSLGRANNFILRLYTSTNSFILNAVFLDSEELL